MDVTTSQILSVINSAVDAANELVVDSHNARVEALQNADEKYGKPKRFVRWEKPYPPPDAPKAATTQGQIDGLVTFK